MPFQVVMSEYRDSMVSGKSRSAFFGAAFVLATCGCTDSLSSSTDADLSPSLYETAASPAPPELGETLMSLEPTVPGPGAVVRLSFPETSQRGGYFQLRAWTGSTWADAVYLLESDGASVGGRAGSLLKVA